MFANIVNFPEKGLSSEEVKSTTEKQLKSNVGKPLQNSMVWTMLQG